MKNKDCFIIAPISTPKDVLDAYRGDANHFIQVLKQLVVPAVNKAGLNPIEPIMEGSDVIHANIIRNLEEAPLVLCDISSLNPNVMLELGIRTALNKPVCIIKDDVTPTERVPFDLSIINNHTYHSDPTWTLVSEIEKLAKHLEKSSADEDNALWKYFGLRLTAHPPPTKEGADNQLDLLLAEVGALRKEIKAGKGLSTPPVFSTPLVSGMPPEGYSGFSRPASLPLTGSGSPWGVPTDYMPFLFFGTEPAVSWITTSGTNVGAVMLELFNKAFAALPNTSQSALCLQAKAFRIRRESSRLSINFNQCHC